MKNYKLLIINGSGALRAMFVRRLRRGNNALRNLFFFSPKALTINVRRTQIPFIIRDRPGTPGGKKTEFPVSLLDYGLR